MNETIHPSDCECDECWTKPTEESKKEVKAASTLNEGDTLQMLFEGKLKYRDGTVANNISAFTENLSIEIFSDGRMNIDIGANWKRIAEVKTTFADFDAVVKRLGYRREEIDSDLSKDERAIAREVEGEIE